MKGAYKFVIAAVMAVMVAWSANATTVTFQCNMSVQEELGNFVPGNGDLVVARGSFNDWGGNAAQLTLNGDVYSVDVSIDPADIEYKFVIVQAGGDVWENVDNRTATIAGDTQVIDPVYFNNVSSAVSADVEVNLRVDMNVQILTGNFDTEADLVVVRGGHPNLGNWGGAVALTEETGNPGIFSAWISFDNLPVPDQAVEYKFVYLTGGDENQANWESSDNRSFTPTGEEADNLPPPGGNGYGEIMPELVYFANVTPDDIITNDLSVVFRVEATPLDGRIADEGFVYDVQTGDTIYSIESLEAAGYFNNWPWGNFAPEHSLNDDGENGDEVAGDDIYSTTVLFPAGSPRELIYKYGANQLDVEAGFALNHIRVLDDSNPTFVMDIDCWGSPDTLYEEWPCTTSDLSDGNGAFAPLSYTLSQNYPNPFNPTTTIDFAIPLSENVKLTVFDLLGRQVSVKDFGRLSAGTHSHEFDASGMASGVYFYKLEGPNFAATKKMLLMK